jgi:hypothetical protein
MLAGLLVENSGKSPDELLNIIKKSGKVGELSKKSPAELPDFCKNVR